MSKWQTMQISGETARYSDFMNTDVLFKIIKELINFKAEIAWIEGTKIQMQFSKIIFLDSDFSCSERIFFSNFEDTFGQAWWYDHMTALHIQQKLHTHAVQYQLM